MVRDNNYSADKMAQAFGITVANQMANVQARVLPPPMVSIMQHSQFDDLCFLFYLNNSKNDLYFNFFQLKYHESGKEKTVAPSLGQWNMINKVILYVLAS